MASMAAAGLFEKVVERLNAAFGRVGDPGRAGGDALPARHRQTGSSSRAVTSGASPQLVGTIPSFSGGGCRPCGALAGDPVEGRRLDRQPAHHRSLADARCLLRRLSRPIGTARAHGRRGRAGRLSTPTASVRASRRSIRRACRCSANASMSASERGSRSLDSRAWLDGAAHLDRTRSACRVAIDVANDPFFGRTGRLYWRASQREESLKFELLVPILAEEHPTACVSFN